MFQLLCVERANVLASSILICCFCCLSAAYLHKCDRNSARINCHKRVTIDFQNHLTLHMGKLC